MLEEHQGGGCVEGKFFKHVPHIVLVHEIEAVLSGFGSEESACFCAFFSGSAQTHKCPDHGTELHGGCRIQLRHLDGRDVTFSILVHDHGVDHPNGVVLTQPFELLENRSREVGVLESECDELYRPNGHVNLLVDRSGTRSGTARSLDHRRQPPASPEPDERTPDEGVWIPVSVADPTPGRDPEYPRRQSVVTLSRNELEGVAISTHTRAVDDAATGGSRTAGRNRAVVRRDLIRRIRADESARVVTLVAPAGYGKSTVLSQWIDEESTPAALVNFGQSHNDPARLLRDLTDALARVGILPEASALGLQFSSATAMSTGVSRLRRSLDGSPPGLLVLDGVESLRSTISRDVVAELILVMPPAITIAIASRAQLPMAIGALRSQGELLELTANDLAMSVDEAGALAEMLGVDMTEEELETVVLRTEGWPTGLYLTYLAIRSGTAPSYALGVGGDDRYISQYLRSEVLSRMTPARTTFLLRTSILEELSSEICDFVVERTGSERVLRSLEESSRFVIPTDRVGHGYRYHQLLREFLQSELRRSEPEVAAGLHLRAAQWFENHGQASEAIHHAMAAGNPARVADLVQRWGRTVFDNGRGSTLLEWIEWFVTGNRLHEYPGVALLGALASAQLGDQAAADRFMAVVDDIDDLGPLAPVVHLANAIQCRNGVTQALIDSEAALALISPASEWYPSAAAVRGLNLLWSGATDAAQARFEVAAEAGERFLVAPTATFALATLATLCTENGDAGRAEELARRALSMSHRSTLETYATSVLSYVVAARCALHRGDPDEAHALLGRAYARRPALSAALPLVAVQTLVQMAELQIEMADYAGAREISREIGAILARRPVGALEERHRELVALLSQMPAGRTGAATLTNAELRLLPLLATHLSFPEIGERLYISRHTVKTEAMSIYRKLGASSRSEAVEQARALRLLII